MKQKYINLITGLFLLCIFPLYAQKDIKGTEFWLTFGTRSGYSYDVANLQIRIVTGNQAAIGSIYFTHLNDSVPFYVAAWSVFTHDLTLAQRQVGYNDATGISDYSIHITSDNLVTVYALNQKESSTDATHILPVTALGTDYYHISYRTFSPDAYAVLAIQDNTQVYHSGTLAATLNRGEVYYRATIPSHSSNLDMTGTHITTDKAVAFFATHQGVLIPNNWYFAVDNLFEQLAPVYTWGKSFFVPVSHMSRDFVRIIISQNGTNIKQTGAIRIVTGEGGQPTLTNLNAGQWVELEVSLDSNGCYIQADKPVGVCTYLAGCEYISSIIEDTISDPAQAWLPAIEQRIKSTLVAPFIPTDTTNLNDHRALIITPTATKGSTTIKIGNGTEQPLSGGTWHDHSSGYSFYNLQLTNDTSAYLFSNSVGGLIVMGYGVGRAESYYYLLGSAMRNLEAAFYVNDVHYQDLMSDIICMQPVQFRAEIGGDISTSPGHLKWYIDDVEEVAVRDQLTWSKPLPFGIYQIKMVVLYDDDITTQTLETTITVLNANIDVKTTPEICNKEDGTITLTVLESRDSTAITYIWEGRTDTTATLTELKAGAYTVTITDAFCVVQETIIVEHVDGVRAEFEANPQTASLGEEIQFIDKSIPGDGNITSWYWNFADETESYLQNPVHTYIATGSFMVLLKVADELGCRDSIEHEVLILKDLNFPNIFTPLGNDGKKYFFRPFEDGAHFEEFAIYVYDRWGVLVWNKECKAPNCPDYDDSFWWDGTNKWGKQVSDGVYYWVVHARYYSSKIKPLLKNGSVTVVGK